MALARITKAREFKNFRPIPSLYMGIFANISETDDPRVLPSGQPILLIRTAHRDSQ